MSRTERYTFVVMPAVDVDAAPCVTSPAGATRAANDRRSNPCLCGIRSGA